MALSQVAAGAVSGRRNAEALLVLLSAGFLALAWRALEAAGFDFPTGSGRILTQFLLVAGLGHLALRVVAPRAAAVPYAAALMLTAVGLAFVTRLSPPSAQAQANWAVVGVALMAGAALASRRYEGLRRWKYTAAVVAVLLLVATGFLGETRGGARLWVTIAGQTIQTTEIIKLFVIVFLAGYLADEGAVLSLPRMTFGGRTYSALPYLVPLLLTLVAALAALALLKDLGTIAILLLLTVAVLYVATGRMWFVAGGLLLLACTGVFGYLAFDHAHTRIDVWLSPYEHADGAGYQTVQSIYAIQAGGVTGEGLGLGEPDVVPAAQTDYIYTAIAEELGLAGAIGVAMLYLVLLVAGLQVALEAPNAYGRLLASAIALLVGIQAAVIIAGNLRMIPTTGVTLPFVSYGGSSLVVNFLLVGMLLGISEASARVRR